MKVFSPILIGIILFCACFVSQSTNNLTTELFEENHILFYSNEQELHKESPYYDALIELKRQYPEQLKKMKVVNPEMKTKEQSINHSYPALVIIVDHTIIYKIDGLQSSKEDIIHPISAVLDTVK
ncbi:hypothetical protein [Bacillus sp. 2205SS5-2]|uniref:hypothetical protein n=1 Tax=Bacillus sp. 2205SS5-2 TaxID=3109031 RepID=UPI0030066C6D